MKIVYLGDIVAKSGREAVLSALQELRQRFRFDVLIANVDNAAHGFGCTGKIAQTLLDAGVDALVTGDHVFDQKDIFPLLNTSRRIVRPLNYPATLAGKGAQLMSTDSGKKFLVSEVVGRVFMSEVANPLTALDELLQNYRLQHEVDAIFIDIHAEASAEKQALAHYFDGRVSAVIGSHTHVPTIDAVILPKGTAYQTDAGMCGCYQGVIGFECAAPIDRLKDKDARTRLEPLTAKATVCGTFIETDDATGLAVNISPFRID